MKMLRLAFSVMLFYTFAHCGEREKVDELIKILTTPKNIKIDKRVKNPFIHTEKLVQPSLKIKEKEPMPDVAGVINKKAMINGNLYKAGDTVNGFTIQMITEEGVTFMKNGMIYAEKFANGKNKILIKRDR